jgi:16S rRNA (cytosine967-C5)-methyltransferase
VSEGAYANLALPSLLERSQLDERDRAFVTELVYGSVRMQRACDWLVDRFLFREVEPEVRSALRLGAYQLIFLGTPPHAAVGETVGLAPGRARGLVNAVLRKVADAGVPAKWPDDATRLSYPDWIVERMCADLGADVAHAALLQMNEPARVTERADGYIQDEASQLVAGLLNVAPGNRVLDVCAAPGGKATLLAQFAPSLVAAGDRHRGRAGLVAANVAKLGAESVATYVADGRRNPFRPAAFDRVLVDAPCSGLGVLRRRADARWRITPESVGELAQLQRALLEDAATSVASGGLLLYSVCTLTDAETRGIDEWAVTALAGFEAEEIAEPPWERFGRGARLLPQTIGSDGMYVLRLRRTAQ